jgi:hypothetical protein
VTPSLLSLNSLKSEISVSLLSGPTSQLYPLTTVARGTFLRVHVTIGDVIESHHSYLSSLGSTTQIFSAFRGFGHWEFVHLTSQTSFYQNPKITVYLSTLFDGQLPSYDLWCRSFWNFGFWVSEVFPSLTSHLPTLRNPKGFRD